MRKKVLLATSIMAAFCTLGIGSIQAQSPTVDYGVVTKVNPVELGEGGNNSGTAVGALLGGAAGYAIGKGSSSGKNGAAYLRAGPLAG